MGRNGTRCPRVALGVIVLTLVMLLGPAAGSAAPVKKVTGVFTVVHADTRPGVHAADKTFYYLRASGKAYRLRFPKTPRFRPSQEITVTGNLHGHDLTVQSAQVAGPVAGQTTTGTHGVLVMMVDWTAPDTTTPAHAAAQIGSTDNAWYQGTSYGQLGLQATVTPWMTIPDSTQGGTTCNLYQIVADAEAASTQQGYTPSSFAHEMIYIPPGTPGCSTWAGQAEVNGRITWIYGIWTRASPSTSWATIWACGIPTR